MYLNSAISRPSSPKKEGGVRPVKANCENFAQSFIMHSATQISTPEYFNTMLHGEPTSGMCYDGGGGGDKKKDKRWAKTGR